MYICSMKQRIYRIRNKRLVQGDSNLLDTNEILVKEDEMGVRLLSREGSEVKDIAYNPADKHIVPEDPYENVIWGRIHYKNKSDKYPDGRNFTPFMTLQYTDKYRYVFRIRMPSAAEHNLYVKPPKTTDLDIRIRNRRKILGEYHVKDLKYDVLYFCDTEGNVSEVPREKTYRVRNCGGELLDSSGYIFIAENSMRIYPPCPSLGGHSIKNKFWKELAVHKSISEGTTFYFLYKNNRLIPGFIGDTTNLIGYIRVKRYQ